MNPLHNSVRLLASIALASSVLSPSAAAHEGHDDSDAAEVMLVAAVTPGGPAAKAGLVEGDRILRWGGENLRSQTDLNEFLARHEPGDQVPLEIDRNGETLSLQLTFGDGGDGRPRLGVSIGVESSVPPAAEDKVTRDECRFWLAETYRVEALGAELGLDLDQWIAENSACVDRDLSMMPSEIPRGWCDNVFKVHCSGLDLLAEIGDVIVDRCESQLSETLGFDLSRDKTWNVCGEPKVFDAYSMEGRVSDSAACQSIFVEDCGGPADR